MFTSLKVSEHVTLFSSISGSEADATSNFTEVHSDTFKDSQPISIPVHCLLLYFDYLSCLSVLCGGPKNFTPHSFNTLIIPISKDCMNNRLNQLFSAQFIKIVSHY